VDPVVIESATVEQVTLPPEPSREPLPPPGAPDLEALFPTEIGGEPVTGLRSANGLELRQQFAPGVPATTQLEAILGGQGKTIEDMSVATGGALTDGGPVTITIVQVDGADVSQLIGGFGAFIMEDDGVQQQPANVGGKTVVVLTPGPDGPSLDPIHAYASGDLLWLVSATEPLLSEILTKLP
jgi:hypothetical protein